MSKPLRCLGCGFRISPEELSLDAFMKDHPIVKTVEAHLGNGFVGAAFHAYNRHLHLVLRPDDVSGWINVFIPFSNGKFCIQDQTEHSDSDEEEPFPWGYIDTGSVSPSTVEVPVKINDNGRIYQTLFYAGSILCTYDQEKNEISPSVDLAIVDLIC